MLDLGAARQRGGAHALGAVGVHHRAEPLGPGLSAERGQLGIGEGLRSAVPDAPGGEDLDHIGAGRFAVADQPAELLGGKAGA